MIMTVNICTGGQYTVIYTEKLPPKQILQQQKKLTDTQTIAHLGDMFSVKLKGKW